MGRVGEKSHLTERQRYEGGLRDLRALKKDLNDHYAELLDSSKLKAFADKRIDEINKAYDLKIPTLVRADNFGSQVAVIASCIEALEARKKQASVILPSPREANTGVAVGKAGALQAAVKKATPKEAPREAPEAPLKLRLRELALGTLHIDIDKCRAVDEKTIELNVEASGLGQQHGLLLILDLNAQEIRVVKEPYETRPLSPSELHSLAKGLAYHHHRLIEKFASGLQAVIAETKPALNYAKLPIDSARADQGVIELSFKSDDHPLSLRWNILADTVQLVTPEKTFELTEPEKKALAKNLEKGILRTPVTENVKPSPPGVGEVGDQPVLKLTYVRGGGVIDVSGLKLPRISDAVHLSYGQAIHYYQGEKSFSPTFNQIEILRRQLERYHHPVIDRIKENMDRVFAALPQPRR